MDGVFNTKKSGNQMTGLVGCGLSGQLAAAWPGEVLPKGVVSSVGSAGFFPDRPPSRRRLGGFKGLPRPENCKQHSKLLQGGDAARLGRTAQPNAVCGATEPIEVT